MNTKETLIYSYLDGKNADLILLILTSQRIPCRVEHNSRLFDIYVAGPDRDHALSAVAAYFRENKKESDRQQVESLPISSFYSPATLVIMGLITGIHILCQNPQIAGHAVHRFGASALYILQGETYRAITALFLHADIQHLLGNLAGLLLFAGPVISISGFGAGSFMLLFSGTLGNLLNAYFYRTAHLSIGASTAVMGAAGLLAAFQVSQKRPVRLRNLVPVISGAVLVALFSQGERTDVWAHVFGFISGLGSGFFFFPLNRVMTFKHKDTLFLLAAIVITASALTAGFMAD